MVDLAEKYRPKTLSDIKGQADVINKLRNIIERYKNEPRLPHLLFVGPVGVGKTSTAYAIANELGAPIKEFNATHALSVELMRGEIRRRAKMRGLVGAFGTKPTTRIVFLDECDSMEERAQQALRRQLETTKSTTFIFSFNDPSKITRPLKSRCTKLKFQKLSEDVVLDRLIEICRSEGYFNTAFPADAREGLLALVRYANGDMRDALSELPKYVTSEGLEYKSMMKLEPATEYMVSE